MPALKESRYGVLQRGVQPVIGRLITDRVFRRRVERGGSAYLSGLRFQGLELTRTEIADRIGVDPVVWTRVAKQITLGSSRRGTPENDADTPGQAALTFQQQRPLRGVCDGLSNRDIATQLGRSESAVKAVLQHQSGAATAVSEILGPSPRAVRSPRA